MSHEDADLVWLLIQEVVHNLPSDLTNSRLIELASYPTSNVTRLAVMALQHRGVQVVATGSDSRSAPVGEWSGSPCSEDPDNCWIDDATGEHVNATTNERTRRE